MTPKPIFLNQGKQFWAYVRTISQAVGYTVRGEGQIKVPSPGQIKIALENLGLNSLHVVHADGKALGLLLTAYLNTEPTF